jgi:hypothetical protein
MSLLQMQWRALSWFNSRLDTYSLPTCVGDASDKLQQSERDLEQLNVICQIYVPFTLEIKQIELDRSLVSELHTKVRITIYTTPTLPAD